MLDTSIVFTAYFLTYFFIYLLTSFLEQTEKFGSAAASRVPNISLSYIDRSDDPWTVELENYCGSSPAHAFGYRMAYGAIQQTINTNCWRTML